MALPVLDGNQSATTLSSVVTGGEHIVAHSVVCFGSTAISNITNAVSGSVVSVSNFPTTQPIAGTVTANLFGYDQANDQQAKVKITEDGYLAVALQANNLGNIPISGTVTANAGGDFAGAIEPVFDISNVSHKVAVQLYDDGGSPIGIPNNPLPISGTVTVGNSITIGSLPAISGTVTVGNSITIGSLPAISGTVTIGAIGGSVTIPVRLFAEAEGGPSSGQDTLVLCDSSGQLLINAKSGGSSVLGYDGNAFVSVKQVSGSSVTIGSLPAISGTVTVAAPNGALTTRFGTPTTANTAFATSAVTNATRKYLLIQNVTTGSNVITVGIGFTPTTTQGIQLTAGAGITFESSYIPTGAVMILSSVTASNFTILEA